MVPGMGDPRTTRRWRNLRLLILQGPLHVRPLPGTGQPCRPHRPFEPRRRDVGPVQPTDPLPSVQPVPRRKAGREAEWVIKDEQAAERRAFGSAWRSDGGLRVEAPWVVTEANGAVINPDTLLGRWRRVVRSVGVPDIPLHGARHPYANLALEAGARLEWFHAS
jgi:hypothetical protein